MAFAFHCSPKPWTILVKAWEIKWFLRGVAIVAIGGFASLVLDWKCIAAVMMFGGLFLVIGSLFLGRLVWLKERL